MKWTPPPGFWERRGLPPPEVEYKFHPTRKWRFDFAWQRKGFSYQYAYKVALEVEGGTWMKGGGHGRGSGYLRDMEKYNEAARLGWKVYRFTPEQLNKDEIMIRNIPKNYKGKFEKVSEFMQKELA